MTCSRWADTGGPLAHTPPHTRRNPALPASARSLRHLHSDWTVALIAGSSRGAPLLERQESRTRERRDTLTQLARFATYLICSLAVRAVLLCLSDEYLLRPILASCFALVYSPLLAIGLASEAMPFSGPTF